MFRASAAARRLTSEMDRWYSILDARVSRQELTSQTSSSCASPSENCGSLQPSACGAYCAAILREAAYVED